MEENHLRGDSLGQLLALAAILEHFADEELAKPTADAKPAAACAPLVEKLRESTQNILDEPIAAQGSPAEIGGC